MLRSDLQNSLTDLRTSLPKSNGGGSALVRPSSIDERADWNCPSPARQMRGWKRHRLCRPCYCLIYGDASPIATQNLALPACSRSHSYLNGRPTSSRPISFISLASVEGFDATLLLAFNLSTGEKTVRSGMLRETGT